MVAVQQRIATLRSYEPAPVARPASTGAAAPSSTTPATTATSAIAFARALTQAQGADPSTTLLTQALARGTTTTLPAGVDGIVANSLALAGVSGSGGPAGTASAPGTHAVATGARYLGVPYRWGGTDPSTGLDCSGFVQRVYRDLGVELPRVSRDQARIGQPIESINAAKPGDIVAFGEPVNHVGIYAGNGMMIHSPHTGSSVRFERVYDSPSAIRRVSGPVSTIDVRRKAPATGNESTYAPLFADAEARYGLPHGALTAVARAESGFNANAVSRAGAQGLMQLMPATARGLGVDPFDPAQAVDGAARLLSGNLEAFGSLELALAAYNAGGGAVSRYGGVPPYRETQQYVQRILRELEGGAS
jgi:cell wall-associated NlpC family hydrolase